MQKLIILPFAILQHPINLAGIPDCFISRPCHSVIGRLIHVTVVTIISFEFQCRLKIT